MKKLLIIVGISFAYMGTSMAHNKVSLPKTLEKTKIIPSFDDALSANKDELLTVGRNDRIYKVYHSDRHADGVAVRLECLDCPIRNKAMSTTEIVLVSNIDEGDDDSDFDMLPKKDEDNNSVSYDMMKTLFLHQTSRGCKFSVGDSLAINPYAEAQPAPGYDTTSQMYMKVTVVEPLFAGTEEIGQKVHIEEHEVTKKLHLFGLIARSEQRISQCTYTRSKVGTYSTLHRVECDGIEKTVTKNTPSELLPERESAVTVLSVGIAALCIAKLSTFLFGK